MNLPQGITSGSRVVASLIDGEEGFGYEEKGIVTTDWEKINYDKKVDVKLDNGKMLLMYPKWMLREESGLVTEK